MKRKIRQAYWISAQKTVLIGLEGIDILSGGIRGDLLDGGYGNNILTGNKGPDTFRLSRGEDTITDFNPKRDGLHIGFELEPHESLEVVKVGLDVRVNHQHGSTLIAGATMTEVENAITYFS